MKKLLATLVTAGVLSTGAYAACSGGTCSNVKIESLMVLTSGTISVGTTGNERGLRCSAAGGKYLAIASNAPGKNAMYSALLTAQTTKKAVSLRLNDTGAACKISYVMSK